MIKLSKSQIDRLGDRLRKNSPSELDLKNLNDYRRSFSQAYEIVIQTLREQLSLEPTGRPAKSTSSLIEKLHRESIRLSQVQDIAGCRILVSSIADQEQVIESLRNIFPEISVVDRRINPSHGYRAVHVIVQISGKLIEIQVRSTLQHLWAEFSEKLSDQDPNIKYGGGDDKVREALKKVSNFLATLESIEMKLKKIQRSSAEILHRADQKTQNQIKQDMHKVEKQLFSQKEDIVSLLEDAIIFLEKEKKQ